MCVASNNRAELVCALCMAIYPPVIAKDQPTYLFK